MPHLFYCLDLQPYTWTHLHRDPGPISSVLLACLGRNIHLQRVPLSENPDFKPIRNAVVRAAVELDMEQRQTQNQNYTPPLLPLATRLLRQVGQIFARQFNLDPPVARLVDKKLRQKIAEKKLAHGQKLEM